MSTPILTKKQQRHSLSAKKGPIKGLRNILAQPFENYWPIVNQDQCSTLVTLLNELLPLIKRSTFTIPGSMLRHMSKEKRVLARKEALEKEIKPDENILKSVILGINAVTRALEKDNICCVLLDANVEPPILVKHIIVMAQNKKIPILLLPALKMVSLQAVGFATTAFALKQDVMDTPSNIFHALYKLVSEIFKDFEPPTCSLQLFKSEEKYEQNIENEVKTTRTNCNSSTTVSQSEKPVATFTDVYKYRSSRKERIFVPPSSEKNSQIFQTSSSEFTQAPQTPSSEFTQAPQTSSSEFISISHYSDPDDDDENSRNILHNKRYVNIHKEGEKKTERIHEDNGHSLHKGHTSRKRKGTDVTYLSLKVKRIQGNTSRLKATKLGKKKK